MGKNTSSVINQNSNNLWSTINSNNSDWIKNEDKNLNYNINNSSTSSNQNNNNNIISAPLNRIVPNNTINLLNETTNKQYINLPINSDIKFYDNNLNSNSHTNINNYQQQQSNNKTSNMNPSFLDTISTTTPILNNKINIMDMSHNNPNSSGGTPKLFSNKEDSNSYYFNSLNNNISLSNYINGNDSTFLSKKDIFEDTMNNPKLPNSNKNLYLSNLNNNFNNTSIEQDINAINNDFFTTNNNESMYNHKNNSEFLNSESSPSRIILISEIPEYFNFNQLINENLSKYGEIRQVFLTKKKSILIIYWDIKSAIDAYDGIHRELSYGNTFSIYFVDPSDIQNYVPLENIKDIMDNQGSLYIVLNQSLNKSNIKLLLMNYGKMRKFYQSKKNVFVEYEDVRSTEKALNSLQELLLKGKLLYAGYSKPGNWLLNNTKDNNEFIRYTSNDTIKQNNNLINKDQINNNTNYLNNFNDLTFMNNNWYSPYKTDLFTNDSPGDNKFNKENNILGTNNAMSLMTSSSKMNFSNQQYFNRSIRNNDVLLSPNSMQSNVDNSSNYQNNSDTLKDDIENISEQFKNMANITPKIDVSTGNTLNNGSDFGIIGDQRHNQNIYNDNMFMFNQMKPILNSYPIGNKILTQPVNTNRMGGAFAGNAANFNMNSANSMINNVNNMNNLNNMSNINHMNNIGNINNMNNMNGINNMNNINNMNLANINNINNMGNINGINNYPINIQQNQDIMMPYNSNISPNTNMNSKSSYLFNSDSRSPTNNSSNNILRVNNVTPSNSTITTTSSHETPLSDIGDILSSNNSTSSKIIPVTSHNYMNLPNAPLNNYNSSMNVTTNNGGNMNNMNNVSSHPLKIMKSNSPPVQNKNNSCNTPNLSTLQMLNDKSSNNNNMNGMKIKNKNSIGGISTNNNSSQMTSNDYVDTYHRRITMEERRMCQSAEDNRKNNKNGNNNMNINERQMNQSSNSKRHVIPRGNELILSRVISGLDDRTTFMIRNIPNKYTQQMLIDTINDTHFGQFDFLYLRMDFKNRCNVGYAFINFVDIKAVISFAEKVVGKKWTRFNSDKICTLSYANIQGRDSLIEKFKNSSVMLEDPSYRPKIFYTSGELKGQEEPFPPPTIPLQFKPYSSVLLNSNMQKSTVYNNSNNNNNNNTNNNNKTHNNDRNDRSVDSNSK